MHIIDSHCHLNFEGLKERLPEVLSNMEANGVGQALAISVSRESFSEVFAVAEAHEHIYCTIGVHPDSKEAEEFSIAEMAEAAAHPKVVGIGETGLDYYWCKGDLSWQHKRFADHIEAANQTGLPVIVHTRDAAADTLAILKECKTNSGVIHCFSEDVGFARAAMDLGLYISFSGIVTFKNAPLVQEAAKYVPDDRIFSGNRCAVPCPRSQTRQAERTGFCASYCRTYCQIAESNIGTGCGIYDGKLLPAV